MNLNLTSNIFDHNEGVDGGALYLMNKKESYLNEEENIINIENNIFNNNTAKNFGGAIYSEYGKLYMAKSKNNTISFNKAGIMGGGVYSPKNVDKNLFINNFSDYTFYNNTVNYHNSDYTSKLSYILLETNLTEGVPEITSGSYFPLVFSLHDEFGSIVEDAGKFYSGLIIKLYVKEKYSYSDGFYNETKTDTKNEIYKATNIHLSGNTSTMKKGKIELNYFQIYAFPNLYTIEIKIENYDDAEEVELRFNDIDIRIVECNKNQIIMYNNKGIEYCAEPICNEKCPVGIKARCVPTKRKNINDINLNSCECEDGWEGEFCDTKIFIEFK